MLLKIIQEHPLCIEPSISFVIKTSSSKHESCPESKCTDVGLGDLRVTFSPRDPQFAGSNPAEVDGFF